MQNTLFIMVKYPQAGRVKTRLGNSLGYGRAVNIYRSLMAKLFVKMCHDPRWQTVLAVSPENTLLSPCWPLGVWRMPQVSGDLGDRMGYILTKAPPGRVVIIGADCPYIEPTDIAAAFESLKKNDVVFGPSMDGGYWLVGQKGIKRPPIFENVRWSCEHTYDDTVRNCHALKIGRLRILRDVDEVEDYKAWINAS